MMIRNKVGEFLLSMAKFVINTVSIDGIIFLLFIYQTILTCVFCSFGVIAIPELITMKDTSSNMLSVVIACTYLLLGPVYVFFSILFYRWFAAILNKISDK